MIVERISSGLTRYAIPDRSRVVLRVSQLRRLFNEAGPPPVAGYRSSKPTTASFDIFETLVSVAIAPSRAIWIELGRRLAPTTGISPKAFLDARSDAIATLGAGGMPITLELIYRELGRNLSLDTTQALELAKVELQLIADLLRPIEEGRQVLERSRSNTDHPITFLSDMHLPGAFLREQLQRFGLWKDGDELWVSGEAGERKLDGGLFRLVAEHGRHVATDRAQHIGDDIVADVIAARWSGWSGSLARWGRPNVYEKLLSESPEARSGTVVSAVAGVARQQRLASASDHADRAALLAVTNSVAAPFMAMYAVWLLRRAQEMELSRLYFLSRDGEVLQRIVNVLARALDLPIETRYLFGGRAVWQRAAMGLPDDGGLIAVVARQELFRYGDVSVCTLASRFGMDGSEILAGANLPEGTPEDRLLDRSERERVLSFLASRRGHDQIRSAAREPLETALDFLSQEGLLRDDRWALVDVGWRGNTVQALNSLLAYADHAPARALFIGYLGSRDEPLPRCDAYLWDARNPSAPTFPRGAVSVVEAFCSGRQGPTSGYERREDGSIDPVLRRANSAAADLWVLDEFRDAIDAYADRLAPLAHPGWLDDRTDRVAARLLEQFVLQASPEESRLLGGCPREEDAQGDVVHPLAREFTVGDLPMLVRPQTTSVANNLGWPRASLMLSPRHRRFAFWTAAALLRGASRKKTDMSASCRPSNDGALNRVKSTNGDGMRLRNVMTLLAEDFRTHGKAPTSPGFHALAVHRLAQFAREVPVPFGPAFRLLTTACYVFVRNVYGIELPPQASIGRRVKISHQSGIVISGDAVIGDECRIRQNVTIGSRGKANPRTGRRKPVLGRRVYVGVGATILGGVTIGSDARIGANALVVEDVPAGGRVYAPLADIVPPQPDGTGRSIVEREFGDEEPA